MEFNTTFNNISVISWQSVLLVMESGVPRENYRPVASRRQTLGLPIKTLLHLQNVYRLLNMLHNQD